jgi:hypothetical protein
MNKIIRVPVLKFIVLLGQKKLLLFMQHDIYYCVFVKLLQAGYLFQAEPSAARLCKISG